MGWLASAFKKIEGGTDWLSHHLGWISGGVAVVMTFAVIREVVGRYFFHKPTDWSLELNEYLLVGMAYFSAAFTEQIDGHIRIDFIYERFRGKTKKIADSIIPLIGLIWSATVMWQGGRLAWGSLINWERSNEAMMWPLFPSQVTIPIGAFLLCLVLLGKIVKNIKSLGQGGN